ncbi:MAG: transcription-repair coupling factor [Planctomycetota bacterium]|nr:transcription-repair coupling factor [Planctomycetota bacterium]MDI6786999.1 transcription-repair coupling factor [Planctomycetota bacterium]
MIRNQPSNQPQRLPLKNSDCFLKPRTQMTDFRLSVLDDSLKSVIGNLKPVIKIGGLWGSSISYFITHLFAAHRDKNILVITEDEDSSDAIYEDLSTFLALYLPPPKDFGGRLLLCPPEDRDINNNLTSRTIQDRLLFLNNIKKEVGGTSKIIVVPAPMLHRGDLPSPEVLEKSVLHLQKGQVMSREDFLNTLIQAGYQKNEDVITDIGEFSVRGGILDIFPYGSENPIRIEWEGNRIASIRRLDPESQLSIKSVNEIGFYSRKGLSPANTDNNKNRQNITLLKYLGQRLLVVVVCSERDRPSGNTEFVARGDPPDAHRGTRLRRDKILEKNIQNYPRLYLHNLPTPSEDGYNFETRSLQRFGGGFSNIFKELETLAVKARQVYIFSQNKAEQSHLKELLTTNHFPYLRRLKLRDGRLSQGFYWNGTKTAFISHSQLFNRYRLIRQPKALPRVPTTTEPFWELQRGDFAVHTSYGIGKYLGLKILSDPSGTRISECLTLEYQDKSYLYVPVTQLDRVTKYWGGDKRAIKVDRIGSALWLNRKARVTSAVRKLASELLYIQALRQKSPGFAYPLDTDWQIEFEASFPYEETPDQTTITKVIKEDMENHKPMDRLVCGDVGYGKTELAIRAVFKACTAGKQAAVIAPTTILAQQHYQTFSERMAGYPINIEVISRFRTEREQKDILERIADGKTDIIIGTHRLVQGDIKFKDLGLVIIDEEQRFGVEHKEYFKKVKASIDVLTLSATPIPRTLHLALAGLREISTMTTPPQDRRAIQTAVCQFSENIIREAVLRELNRHGQVYFVHNRIFDIEKIAEKIRNILPELTGRLVIAHGQMPGWKLEQCMQDFINYKYDVLVCTNIIESGLDIPRVNTIFVNNADDFGLSDLHQLRGRVGRYKHQAYAYFLIPPEGRISSDAVKRLKAIEEFNELGAGFKIALRDMEIRGVGNILGREQHGHITAVGYELYCKLLEQAVKQVRGTKIPRDLAEGMPRWTSGDEKTLDLYPAPVPPRRDKTLSPKSEIRSPKSELFIPSEYINSERERLNIYRRLCLAENEKTIREIETELQDRFGMPIPEPALNLIDYMQSRLR